MKVLFTKRINEALVSEKLGGSCSWDYIDTIRINKLDVQSFSVEEFSLIFSSLNAAKAFYANHFVLNGNPIFCVGKKTRDFFVSRNITITFCAANASELFLELSSHYKDNSFLHFCGNLSPDGFAEKFTMHNIAYRQQILYKTELLYPKISTNYDAIVFFSPSGVRSFARYNSLEGKTLLSIGSSTTDEIRNFTENQAVTSCKNTLEDVLVLLKYQIEIQKI